MISVQTLHKVNVHRAKPQINEEETGDKQL